MIQFSCDCGKPLQARDEYAGQVTRCPQCGRELPIPGGGEAVQPADAPRAAPPAPDYRRDRPLGPPPGRGWGDRERFLPPTTSGKAITSLVLGLLSVFVCSVLTGIPAIIFGILGLRDVRRGEGRVAGTGLAITGLVTGVLSLFLTVGIFFAVVKVREAAARAQSSGRLKRMTLAMHDYASATGSLPLAAPGPQTGGRPKLSWRVAILPYVGESALYQQFRQDEPWDGPNNSRLLTQMPKIYALPNDTSAPPGYTYYRVFVGNGAALDPSASNPTEGARMPADFTDGTSQTIVIVEAAEAVPWTKPEGLPFDPNGPLPALGRSPDGFQVGLADGSTRWIDKRKVSEQTLRAAITRNGGEALGPDW